MCTNVKPQPYQLTVLCGYVTYGICLIVHVPQVIFSPGLVCGFVSLFVILFVNKITQKLMDGF